MLLGLTPLTPRLPKHVWDAKLVLGNPQFEAVQVPPLGRRKLEGHRSWPWRSLASLLQTMWGDVSYIGQTCGGLGVMSDQMLLSTRFGMRRDMHLYNSLQTNCDFNRLQLYIGYLTNWFFFPERNRIPDFG